MSKETPYQKWYKANRETLNKERRSRYHTDPEYRQQVIERQRQYRREAASRSREQRQQEGIWRMAETAEQIGRSDQTIRLWEAKGLIPKPTLSGKHRRYTSHQVELMKMLADVLEAPYDNADAQRKAVAEARDEIHNKWSEE